MKRTAAFLRRQIPEPPIEWREAEYAALRTNAADTGDDRVSDDIFDVEDEHVEVDIVAHRMIREFGLGLSSSLTVGAIDHE